jgi:hypothetical protein
MVQHLFVSGNSESVVYGTPLPASVFQPTITGLNLSALTTQPTCANITGSGTPTYVETYTIQCTGPNPADGPGGIDGVTYTNGILKITQFPLTITAVAANKVYDGTTTTTAVLSGNPVNGDVLTYGYVAANFVNKNAAIAIGVNVTGISISGMNSADYTFNTTAYATANISPRPMTITATGVNKVYDGTTAATVTLSDNRVPLLGDIFTDSYAGASFVSKNVGTGVLINVTGISISGTGATNYTFNTTASAAANITPHVLAITAVANKKIYDGTVKAKAIPVVSGLVGTDTVTGLAETYNSPIIGKSKTMSVSSYTINDGNGGLNYHVTVVANPNGAITDRDGDYDNDHDD